MRWEECSLVLFDFDGLLVDTERLHFAAYQQLTLSHGYSLPWNFEQFCKIAHTSALGLKESIYRLFPELEKKEPIWERLYEQKKEFYQDLLKQGQLCLMPGVDKVLKVLQEKNIPRAVVTNSSKAQVEAIKAFLPLLKTIPLWVTREDYEKPKPSPDGYLVAIEKMGHPKGRIVGFEDSLKGLIALQGAKVEAFLICPEKHLALLGDIPVGTVHFNSF